MTLYDVRTLADLVLFLEAESAYYPLGRGDLLHCADLVRGALADQAVLARLKAPPPPPRECPKGHRLLSGASFDLCPACYWGDP